MSLHCPKCSAKMASAKVHAGMKVKCPRCANVFVAPGRAVPMLVTADDGITTNPSPASNTIAMGIAVTPRAPCKIPVQSAAAPAARFWPMALIIAGCVLLVLLAVGGLAALVVVDALSSAPATIAQAPFQPEETVTPTNPPVERPQPPTSDPSTPTPPAEEPRGGISSQPPDAPQSPTPKKPGGGRIGDIQIDFMTSKAKGKRFVIIADRSGSMSAGFSRRFDPKRKQFVTDRTGRRAIDFLHEELIKTVKKFKHGTHYYISFYDSVLTPMPFGDSWLEGNQKEDDVIRWVKSIRPRGGTNPLPAFQKVFALDPRPDVIFFMTDGQIPTSTAPQVKRLNEHGKKVIVNTIQLYAKAGAIPPRVPKFSPAAKERLRTILKNKNLPVATRKRYEDLLSGRGFQNVQERYFRQMEQIAQDSGGAFTKIEIDEN